MDPIIFPILLGLVLIGGRYIYDNFYKLDVEVCFVTIDPKCNCYTNNSRQAQHCVNEDCPSKLMSRILSKIAKAKNSIDIAMYNFTNSDLARGIIMAHRRGVRIRVIVDKSADEKEDNHSQVVEMLKNESIDVRVFGISNADEKKLMHHKFCVIDYSSPDGAVITGSLNWSYTAFKQCEDVLFISNGPRQKQYANRFDGIWQYAKHQCTNSNLPVGSWKTPITVFNNPIGQRAFTTRRQNHIGYRNGGY